MYVRRIFCYAEHLLYSPVAWHGRMWPRHRRRPCKPCRCDDGGNAGRGAPGATPGSAAGGRRTGRCRHKRRGNHGRARHVRQGVLHPEAVLYHHGAGAPLYRVGERPGIDHGRGQAIAPRAERQRPPGLAARIPPPSSPCTWASFNPATAAFLRPLTERQEEKMMTGAVLCGPLRTDGRYGCRGGEVANNTQNRRIACC